jgi:predicted metalloprotease with PDZ domain
MSKGAAMSFWRTCLIVILLLSPAGFTSLDAQPPAAIDVAVDATQAPVKILHVRLSMPAKPGPLTVYYPKWIPGEHGPSGPIGNVADLRFTAGGKSIPWRRDLLDVFTFHLDVPGGVQSIEASFDYIEPSVSGYSFGASATDKLLVVSWNQALFYPAGVTVDQIACHASLRLPQNWKFGTALGVEGQTGNEVKFKPVALNRLVDSPVVAGEYYRSFDLTPSGEPIHHEIDIVADSDAALDMNSELQKSMTNLVSEAGRLFGARHYGDYHFLLTLSDHVTHFGLEHHECNDSRTAERALLTPGGRRGLGSLLPHEFVHSWNGKFRRPADLSVQPYEAPMKTDLLWVYEGLTDYLGHVLAARSGIWTPEQYREYIARTAADLGPGTPGRTWRPLQDTADAVPGLPFLGREGWTNWERDLDYYPEGDLIWLDAAMIIRDQSHGKRSFDDFCRSFFGGPNSGPELKPYTLDDLVEALNEVTPYDWKSFFHERLTSLSPQAPSGGIEAAGWKVEYNDKPEENPEGASSMTALNATYSLGLRVSSDGAVLESVVGKPAYGAGITPGMKIVAVDDRAFTPDLLREALKRTKSGSPPIRLLILNDGYYRTSTINYQGGELFPHLEREEGKPDRLDDILKPRAPHK